MKVITGYARGRNLATLPGADVTRPTTQSTKEALFSSIQFEIEGKRVLDLFAGCGQLGIEALSRGASHCTFVESNRQAYNTVESNIKLCKMEHSSQLVFSDAVSFLSRKNQFDIAFLDPPYNKGLILVCLSNLRKRQPRGTSSNSRRLVGFKAEKIRQVKANLLSKGYINNMKTAICPGSFDPVTLGHLDIIERAADIFDNVIVLVLSNGTKKTSLFSLEERTDLLKRCIQKKNITIDTYNGLLVEYAKQKNAVAIVKGLRAVSDFDWEFQQSLTNKSLNPDVETVFLTAKGENMFLSSSMVKEVCSLGGDISSFVPPQIAEDIYKRCKGDIKND